MKEEQKMLRQNWFYQGGMTMIAEDGTAVWFSTERSKA